MRGALAMEGVVRVDAAPGQRDVTVHCRPDEVKVAAMLDALRRAGEPAVEVP